jgi:hypothetical protein
MPRFIRSMALSAGEAVCATGAAAARLLIGGVLGAAAASGGSGVLAGFGGVNFSGLGKAALAGLGAGTAATGASLWDGSGSLG